jgi:hypothetical protein
MNWRARGSTARLAGNDGETGTAFAGVVEDKSVTPA